MDEWIHFAACRKRYALAALGAAFFMLLLLARSGMPRTYTITDGDRIVTCSTFATDPAQVLTAAGLELDELDSFHASRGDIHVVRCARVTVWFHGEMRVLSAGEETVAQLLARCGLEPGPEDRVSLPTDRYVYDGLELRVDRIWSRQEEYTAAVPHETVYCLDATLPEGCQQVLIPGSDGELQRSARVFYTNAQETSREILTEIMTRPPVTEIVAIGTGTNLPEPEEGLRIEEGRIFLPTGEQLTYRDTAQVRATAYTHTDEGCDFITYTGTRVRIGTVAVDPRYIPYGTRMFIVSNDGCYVYGISVAEDCGGAIKGDRIDLYFPTYEECIQFGRRDCTIYFLG